MDGPGSGSGFGAGAGLGLLEVGPDRCCGPGIVLAFLAVVRVDSWLVLSLTVGLGGPGVGLDRLGPFL